MPKARQTATLAIHAGAQLQSRARPLVPAIHVASVSYFDDAESLDRSMDGQDFVYARINGPNASLLEEAVASLEGAQACVAYASGMAALRAVAEAQGWKDGDAIVIPADCYGLTRTYLKGYAAQRGVQVHSLTLSSPEGLAQLAALRPRFVLAESISNPCVRVTDLRAVAGACKERGAVFAVDATFASPALQQPLALGADYVLHSTTKWINGHSDALGGVVSGSRARMDVLRAARVIDGAILGPFEAYLTLRGLRTLPLRMKAHSEHAVQVAARLAASPAVERVYYPERSDLLPQGAGGMLAFEIRGAKAAHCRAFLEAVRLARPAPSLGDVSTTVMHAATAAARRMTPAEREVAGIRENLIRVSVGLEDPGDITDDLLAAVASAMDGARS